MHFQWEHMHHAVRIALPEDLELTYRDRALSDVQRTALRLTQALSMETPYLFEDELIAFTRTVPNLPRIFDDIECVTLGGDTGALTLAQSFMSRLPENQMKVTTGDAVLTLSKAENGRFDMMIVSAEAAEKYGIADIYDGKNVDVIAVEDETV